MNPVFAPAFRSGMLSVMSKRSDAVRRWREILRRQAESGLSVAAFCRRARVPQSSFYFWRQKLSKASTFAKVRMAPEQAPLPCTAACSTMTGSVYKANKVLRRDQSKPIVVRTLPPPIGLVVYSTRVPWRITPPRKLGSNIVTNHPATDIAEPYRDTAEPGRHPGRPKRH